MGAGRRGAVQRGGLVDREGEGGRGGRPAPIRGLTHRTLLIEMGSGGGARETGRTEFLTKRHLASVETPGESKRTQRGRRGGPYDSDRKKRHLISFFFPSSLSCVSFLMMDLEHIV